MPCPSASCWPTQPAAVVLRNRRRLASAAMPMCCVERCGRTAARRGRGGEAGEQRLTLFGPPLRVLLVRGVPLAGGGALAVIDDLSDRARLDAVRTDFVVEHQPRAEDARRGPRGARRGARRQRRSRCQSPPRGEDGRRSTSRVGHHRRPAGAVAHRARWAGRSARRSSCRPCSARRSPVIGLHRRDRRRAARTWAASDRAQRER